MAVTVLDGLSAVESAVGRHLGFSGWVTLDPESADLFGAAVGGDGPMAHGYLVLSLSNRLLPEIVEVRGVRLGVNYGTERVRFGPPVPIGGSVRAGAEMLSATRLAGGVQTVMRVTIEMEHVDAPACVAEAVSRWLV